MTTPPQRPSGQAFPPMELPPGLAIEYANLVRIAHSPSELVFDFAHLLPGNPHAPISSRIVMSPLGAKLFQRALNENLSRYETTFGEIVVPGDTALADHLFRPRIPPDKSDPPQAS